MTNKVSALKSQIPNILANQVLKGTGIVSIGILTASIISYFLQVVLGRFLTVEDYGTFNSLLSVMYIVNVPSTAVVVALIKVVSDLKAKKDYGTLTKLFWGVSGYAIAFGILILMLVFLFSDALLSYLNIEDAALIIPFALFISLTFINTGPRSYLQGLLRFKAFSFYTVSASILRAGIPITLLLLGFKVGGVFIGMGIALVLAFVIGVLLIRKNFSSKKAKDLSKHYRNLLTFSVPVMVIKVCMMILITIDLILVKHFFDVQTAGLYSGVVTIGKIILFGTGLVATVMFPFITNAVAEGNSYRRKFFFFFGLQVFLVGCGILVFSIIPEFIATTMFGVRYAPAAQYIPMFAVFMGVYAITNFLIMFLLALNKTRISIVLIIAVVLQIALINVYHSTLNIIIQINVLITAAVLFVLIGYLIVLFKRNEDRKDINNTSVI